jgi:N-acetylneuraminate synthase/N,N'-diacetyllegionaminate synthase
MSLSPSSLHIGEGRTIGSGHPVFIVAEAGVNHNGKKEMALALVEAAHHAGADCVKFQTFSAGRMATSLAEKAPYQRLTTRSASGQVEMLKALELPRDAYPEVQAACRERGLVFLSTPYSCEDADFLEAMGVAAYKVASAMIVELAFLSHIARKQKPVLLATGMATLAEVDHAVRAIRDAGNEQLVLLQCTTNYPSRVEDANLRVLPLLRDRFDVQVGYSDHTETPACCVAAVALGAVVIEKHLTLDKTLPGPDHQASADPTEFRRLVDLVRQVELALGTGRKEPSSAELANRPYMRRSIVALSRIPVGAVLTLDMLTFKRPGTGISPTRLGEVVGKRARVVIECDRVIEWNDLEP